MAILLRFVFFTGSIIFFILSGCQPIHPVHLLNDSSLLTGAECMNQYLPLLKNKKVALVVNQSSRVGHVSLVDTLLESGVDIIRIFSPEHGYTGTLDAGKEWSDFNDNKTGLTIVSLYGKNRKPSAADMKDIEIIIFDIQDVGVRFYTYLSTLHYVMEACADYRVPLLVLDRPNPNGFYVDGPVLDEKYKSFVGMHPVPVVHGMTLGEMAKMIDGEGWVSGCDLTVILCRNYNHSVRYILPVYPSPNLRSMRAVYLYPSLGLFEGTKISVGRGTAFPFEVYGHPDLLNTSFAFIPQPNEGCSSPMFAQVECKAVDLRQINTDSLFVQRRLWLEYLIDAYRRSPQKKDFFNPFIVKLYGRDDLPQMIEAGMTPEEIRKTWMVDLEKFKIKRARYLLYPDF